MKNVLKKLIAIVTLCVMIVTLGGAALAANQQSPIYSAEDLFTDRDLQQEPDLSEAETLSLTSGEDIHITAEGTYVLSGEAEGVTVYVEAEDTAKVQLVLDGATITNADFPCVYVVSADKVFLTVTGDSALSVTGTFRADGDTNTDGVIFARDDLTINGTAALTVASSDNGIVCKDDLKLTGGTITVTAQGKGIEANDSIRVSGATLNVTAQDDGLQAKDSDDLTTGYIVIMGGEVTVKSGDDGIHATTVLQIDGGTVTVTAPEGLEATIIQINGGEITVTATDDGINAGAKSSTLSPAIIFNGGYTKVTMGQGDTDGVDSNGDIYVNGGTIEVTGQSSFDCDGTAQYNGGTIIVNGQQIDYIPNQMFGGMMGGPQGGGMGGPQGGGMGGPQGGQQGGWGGRH